MFSTFCASACQEKLPCHSVEKAVCVASSAAEVDCTEVICPCWAFSDPPLARAVAFLAWYLAKLTLGRKIDDETAFALGKSVGWLSMAPDGPKLLTDEEVVVYVRQLADVFQAGLELSNPNFFAEGGSFLGSARSHNPTRKLMDL